MTTQIAPPTRSDSTRAALISAGLRQFGRNGYAMTSTRSLADEAGTNVASIAYHFGGKEGLRRACAEHCAKAILSAIGGSLAPEVPTDPAAAHARLRLVAGAIARFLIGSREAGDFASFMLRELGEAGPGIDIIYAALVGPLHARACHLWGIATGQDPESERVRLSVFAFVGQILYFRIGRPIVMRRMDWSDIGTAELRGITDILLSNLDALLTAERQP